MSASFHFAAGPFSIAVQLDGGGITLRRKTLAGERTETVPWDKISGATLVRPDEENADDEQENERIAQLFGPEAVAKYRELHGKVAQIFVAYRERAEPRAANRNSSPADGPSLFAGISIPPW